MLLIPYYRSETPSSESSFQSEEFIFFSGYCSASVLLSFHLPENVFFRNSFVWCKVLGGLPPPPLLYDVIPLSSSLHVIHIIAPRVAFKIFSPAV